MSKFEDFKICSELLRALSKMKYAAPTPIQEQAIPLLLNGSDLIASSQTGTGKTCAFGIPLMQTLIADSSAQALVIAPTRELAIQIEGVLRELASFSRVSSALVVGGLSMQQQHRALSRRPQLIVATPGRLVDHLRHNKSLLSRTVFVVLDEADRMMDMGFAPQLEAIRAALPSQRQTLLFSATFPSNINDLTKKWMRTPHRVSAGPTTEPIATVTQSVIKVKDADKRDKLMHEVNSRSGSILIFARTKHRTDRLALFLEAKGVSVCRMHGGRNQGQRRAAISGFRSAKYRVMVATDIAARGIDIPRIEHVINFDLPMAAEDYLHRIGRTGRAGRSGESVCMITPGDYSLWASIERLMGGKDQPSAAGLGGNAGNRRNGAARRQGPGGRSRGRHFARRGGQAFHATGA
ncbi:MAG: DEAD/DEAH box helicase [Deltaproteobacteria bacterium]|nr:DEAD/DEAH box helicase [Deltaproteobacteria bacterium]